jgi:acetyltransferase
MISTTRPLLEPAYDILRLNHHPLEPLFTPKTVAVVGASGRVGTVGYTLLWNLVNAPFHGTIVPVTPLTEEILGLPTYPRVLDVPDPVDLAIIVATGPAIPVALQDCIAAGAKTALLVSAGFRESGRIDPKLRQRLEQLVQNSPLRLLGPNSLGIMNPRHGLNATLASAMARPGNIGFISQSGALCRAILNWSFQEKVGFSRFISMGSMLDVGWGDLIRYLGNDPYTQSIVIHMETLGNARSFLAAAREVARSKPIILIKGGQTAAAVRASLSHTGEVLGRDDVFAAALRRCGVLRVDRISELFNMAEVLAKRDYRITGSRLSIITNSGGLGVLATDALMATGGQLAELAPPTLTRLNRVLPPEWSQQNPIDILGDADGERFQRALNITVQDSNTDGVLVILTPQGAADPTDTAERLKDSINRLQDTPFKHKPILASWMGGTEVIAGETILNRYQIPTYPYPDSAARLFNLMGRHSYSLQGMIEVPSRADVATFQTFDRDLAGDIIQSARQAGRLALNPVESLKVLQAYGLPVLATELATSEDRAIAKAEALGYPVVLKLPHRPGQHTPDQGGVQLNLTQAEAVRHAYRSLVERSHGTTVLVQPMVERHGAYELMVTSTLDPHLGPVLAFGKGGRLQEIYQDRAVALPPLTPSLARRTMEQTKIFLALDGQRGYPAVNLALVEKLLVNFSWLVIDHPELQSVHINPLWVRPDGDPMADSEPQLLRQTPPSDLLVLDASITLHDLQRQHQDLPQPALKPYPAEMVKQVPLVEAQADQPHHPDGPPLVTLRPAGPKDDMSMANFLDRLSDQSGTPNRSHLLPQHPQERQQRLQQLGYLDYDHNLALIAEQIHAASGRAEVLAIARLSCQPATATAEFALVVDDTVPGQGLARAMVQQLIQFAHRQGMRRMEVRMLAENMALQRLSKAMGFQLTPAGPWVRAALDLSPI